MRRVTLFLALALAAAVPAAAAPRPISLAEAVRLAESNAPAVVRAEGARRTAKAGVQAAMASFLPSVSLSAGANRQWQAGKTRVVNGVLETTASTPWSYSTGLGASVDLFAGGQRIFDLAQARAQSTGAGQDLVSARYAAGLAARGQFFAVLAARESEASARAQLAQATLQLEQSKLRLRQRVVTRSDSIRSEISVHSAGLAVLQARTSLAQAEASLARAVGLEEPVTAAADDSLDRATLAVDDSTLSRLALDGPAVRSAAATSDAARAALRSAWTRYLPGVSASFSRGGSGSSSAFALANDGFDYASSLRLSVSLPLFQQWTRVQQVVQAQVGRANAEAGLRDSRLAAMESVTQWLGTFRAAAERVAVQRSTVAAAEEDLREQQEKYAIGATTQLDVLASQTTLDQARQDLIQARFDQRVARGQLEALVGRSL
jgi:outer membrane protein